MRVAALAALLAAFALACAGCGGAGGGDDEGGSTSTGSDTLTIYSSLPLHGPSQRSSQSIMNGEKLALDQAGARVGPFTVKYVGLDDATAEQGHWVPGVVSANARKAAQDRTTIAWLGDADSGASAIAVPILNAAAILAVSPTSSAVGLTRAEGVVKGEPDKYYPSGVRTFARVVPNDKVQGAAQAALQRDRGCKLTYVLHDPDVYGADLAAQFLTAAKAEGLSTAGPEVTDPKAADYRDLAATVRGTGADCVFFAGTTHNNAAMLWRHLHAAVPDAELFGGDGLVDTTFSREIGRGAARQTRLTSPALDPQLYPRAGQEFFDRYREVYGSAPEPMAIFGYEAMSAVLQAIKDAGDRGNDRRAVRDAFFALKRPNSPLGAYTIDDNGDTSLRDMGVWRVEDGRLVFDQVVPAR